MARIWIIIAGGCAFVAVLLVLAGKFDAAFVVGAVGILSWFLDVRVRLSKERQIIEKTNQQNSDRSGDQDED